MLSRYYFRCKGHALAPIKASSLVEAESQLEIEHAWIGANKSNSTLIRVTSIEFGNEY